MDDESKVIATLIVCLFVAIPAALLIDIALTGSHARAMVDKGMQQVMVVGHDSPVWQSACPCDSMVRR